MPLMYLNNEKSRVATFYAYFKQLYDDSQYFCFLSEDETVHLQKLEIAQLLSGTQVLIQIDGNQKRWIIIKRDGDAGYKVKLDSVH